MTDLVIPTSYELTPPRRTLLWILLTGKKVELRPKFVRPLISLTVGGPSDQLHYSISERKGSGEFTVPRYASYTAEITRSEALDALLYGDLVIPQVRIVPTIEVQGDTISVTVYGGGGGGGSFTVGRDLNVHASDEDQLAKDQAQLTADQERIWGDGE